MTTGNIILLNGTSSSGKTSLLKELQKALDEPYFDAGLDKFIFMLPGRYLNAPLWYEVFEYIWPENKDPLGLIIKAGPMGHRIVSAMYLTIAALARAGIHVVADHVLIDPRWVDEAVQVLGEFNVLFVGVRCPLEVVEKREKDRKDRTLGQARAQYHVVHAHAIYDLEVDTSLYSAAECALQIKDRLHNGAPPGALQAIRARQQNLTSGD